MVPWVLLNHFARGKYWIYWMPVLHHLYYSSAVNFPPSHNSSWKSREKLPLHPVIPFKGQYHTLKQRHAWDTGRRLRTKKGECVRKDTSHQHSPFPLLRGLPSSPAAYNFAFIGSFITSNSNPNPFSLGFTPIKLLYSGSLTQHTLFPPPLSS